MSDFIEMSDFIDFCHKCRQSEHELLVRSANLAFRNLFDPYCAEHWHDIEMKLDTIRLLNGQGISLLPLVRAFRQHWINQDRNDISDSAIDSLAILIEQAVWDSSPPQA
jgi:hypothetical protein